jgi:hypothetical protein
LAPSAVAACRIAAAKILAACGLIHPPQLVSPVNPYPPLKDSDGDGTPDIIDKWPKDPLRS